MIKVGDVGVYSDRYDNFNSHEVEVCGLLIDMFDELIVYRYLDKSKAFSVASAVSAEKLVAIFPIFKSSIQFGEIYNSAYSCVFQEGFKKVMVESAPCVCSKCKTANEFATPNNPDGTFTCYACRSGW